MIIRGGTDRECRIAIGYAERYPADRRKIAREPNGGEGRGVSSPRRSRDLGTFRSEGTIAMSSHTLLYPFPQNDGFRRFAGTAPTFSIRGSPSCFRNPCPLASITPAHSLDFVTSVPGFLDLPKRMNTFRDIAPIPGNADGRVPLHCGGIEEGGTLHPRHVGSCGCPGLEQAS